MLRDSLRTACNDAQCTPFYFDRFSIYWSVLAEFINDESNYLLSVLFCAFFAVKLVCFARCRLNYHYNFFCILIGDVHFISSAYLVTSVCVFRQSLSGPLSVQRVGNGADNAAYIMVSSTI